ncbi:MAG: hypothetical protein OEX12_04015 [Gammaproteobacteria bacterium]|nr:hypothetical protein [Gammaproteobacteria bacterium]
MSIEALLEKIRSEGVILFTNNNINGVAVAKVNPSLKELCDLLDSLDSVSQDITEPQSLRTSGD